MGHKFLCNDIFFIKSLSNVFRSRLIKFKSLKTLLLSLIFLSSSFAFSYVNPSDFKYHGGPSWDFGAYAFNYETIELEANEKLISILHTNDIHGNVEPTELKKPPTDPDLYKSYGGMSFWAGVVKAIREGINNKYGQNAGVLLLDAGDQFQGRLISNYNEGQLVFSLLNKIGYDAITPGNHAYDLGPLGWLDDRVTPETPDQNRRGALIKLRAMSSFPFLSANTYFRDSLFDKHGRPVGWDDEINEGQINWARARRPEFLQPYIIKNIADVRVAVIGMDHYRTSSQTTADNVEDLFFRNPVSSYLETRAFLQNKADIFILVFHGGNTIGENEASDLAQQILSVKKKSYGISGPTLDVLIGAHTHFINHDFVKNVPVLQSASNMRRYGRVDLVWDKTKKKLVLNKMRTFAGVPLLFDSCPKPVQYLCSAEKKKSTSGRVSWILKYEGVKVNMIRNVYRLIAQAKRDVAPLARQKLGWSNGTIWRSRIKESPLSNALTDALREVADAEISMLNTGGLRDVIDKGVITYEDLFQVLPFSNHGMTITPLPVKKLFDILNRSIKSCGRYSVLMQSGLKVIFSQDCRNAQDGVDYNAKLQKVETVDGEILYDRKNNIEPPTGRVFKVATIDYLLSGGSGYTDFIGVPVVQDLGILREVLVEKFIEEPANFKEELDSRWRSWRASYPQELMSRSLLDHLEAPGLNPSF